MPKFVTKLGWIALNTADPPFLYFIKNEGKSGALLLIPTDD
jgi:hypothetical protein